MRSSYSPEFWHDCQKAVVVGVMAGVGLFSALAIIALALSVGNFCPLV